MQFYKQLQRFIHLGGARTKLAALWVLHILRRRYIGVFIDPALGCNYRCQMCYYSNEEVRKTKIGRMTETQIANTAKALFKKAVKVQIGCSAEPTVNIQGTLQLIRLATQYGVPYISVTSNGILLKQEILREMIESGLDELTISLHGIHKETYEKMMGRTSNYAAFVELLQSIKSLKKEFPSFSVRINYTMNADNVAELADFDTLFGDIPINILQLRPIRQIGDSEYQNFDLSYVSECMDTVVRPLAERCHKLGITVLYSKQENIQRFEKKTRATYRERLIPLFTYYNVTPSSYSENTFDFEKEDYNAYARRCHIGRKMFRGIFATEKKCADMGNSLSMSLNYDIE